MVDISNLWTVLIKENFLKKLLIVGVLSDEDEEDFS